MRESEAKRIMSMLQGVWAARPLSESACEVWEGLLLDLPYEPTKAAVTRLSKLSKWMPSLAEIRAEIVEDRCDLPAPEVAWGQVIKAMHRDGGAHGTPRFEHDEVRQAVDVLGWRTICLDENEAATRARFTDAYRAIRARRVADEVTGRYVPPDRRLESEVPELRLLDGRFPSRRTA